MSDQNANNGTVPVFAPDGSLGDIPAERLTDAVKAGFKPGVTMKSQDGQLGVIPADRVPDAAKGGLSIVPLEQQETQHPGFWHTVYSDLAGMATGGYKGNATSGPDMSGRVGAATKLNEQQTADLSAEDASRKAAGYSLPYRALAPVAEGLGANVAGMEQSAKEGDRGGVAGHAVAAVAPYVTGEVLSQAGPSFANVISKATPQAMRDAAGQLFQTVKAKAGDFPVNVETPGAAALRIKDLADRGGSMPMVVRKFLNRVTDPDGGMMTYSEARDFYSNASRLSADETNRLTPRLKFEVGNFTRQLGQSIQSAADDAGVGAQHAQAMGDYAKAMQYADNLESLKRLAVKGAGHAAAGATTTAVGYEVYKALKDAQ